MRARQPLRMDGAAKFLAGAVVLALAVVAVVLASTSAVARGAQGKPQTASKTKPKRSHLASRFLVRREVVVRPSGSTVVVRGFLMPRRRGAEIKLIARVDGDWRTLARARTERDGRFGIRYRLHGVGTTEVRVDFDGARRARAASADAGRIVALAPTVASWYDDAGNTACGFHATYGVANKTLPCGTKVMLSYGGRTITATVDDRGPFVYGRSFDLNQNTARLLGMWGVAQVLASV